LITRQFLTRSAPHETGGQAITHSRRWGFSSNPFDIENKSDNGLLPVTPDRLVHLLPIRDAWVREKVVALSASASAASEAHARSAAVLVDELGGI
jgi:hypothetical protein